MQRGLEPPLPRGPSSKRVGGPGGSKRRRTLSTVGSPLLAVALFAALLLYSSHRFSRLSSNEDTGFFGGPGRAVAAAAAAGADGGDSSLLLAGGAGGGKGAASGNGALGSLDSVQEAAAQLQIQQSQGHRSSWLSAAVLWAEEHHAARVQAEASVYQAPTGCGVLPCQGERVQRPHTLVLYVYSAADAEQQRNFEFFLRHGVEEQAKWLTYRIILAAGTGILPHPKLPALPSNAAFVHTSQCATGLWGILSAVAGELHAELAAAQHIVVVSSAARGPFLPSYTKQYMHWTDAFTSKLTRRTKLVGSALTCEGAPKGGDAADVWRRNPFILPYAWATDQAGWQVLSANKEVFKCHPNAWDARYYADSGASLALLEGGHNIDSLLAKYQGVDWWNQRTWDCNARVRPDAEWTYDGVSISPYETVFVPVSQGPAQSDWSYVRQAVKYSVWMEAQASGSPQGNSNSFVSDAWTLRAPRLVYANSRGPGCFDFDYYVQHNPDQASKLSQHQLLWEHFVLVGQFQGRAHRFTCPVQIGASYRASFVHARGRRCFDHNHYSTHNLDVRLAGVAQAHELFNHYADFGQFENRPAKFVCTDSLHGLPKGFDTRPLDPIPRDAELRNAEKWKGLVQGAAAEAGASLARQKKGTGGGGGAGEAAAAGTHIAAQQQEQQVASGATEAEQQHQQQAAIAATVQQGQAAAAVVAAVAAEQQQAVTGAAAATAEQQAAATAAQQAQAQGGGGQDAVGDAAADSVAHGRIDESAVEAFQAQQEVQAAAGAV